MMELPILCPVWNLLIPQWPFEILRCHLIVKTKSFIVILNGLIQIKLLMLYVFKALRNWGIWKCISAVYLGWLRAASIILMKEFSSSQCPHLLILCLLGLTFWQNRSWRQCCLAANSHLRFWILLLAQENRISLQDVEIRTFNWTEKTKRDIHSSFFNLSWN